MSRYGDYDSESDYSNASDLWYHNLELALGGKRGKKALADLREGLLALPEKRLIERALCTVGGAEKRPGTERLNQPEGVCAVGAYIWWQKVKGGMDPQAAFDSLPTLEDEAYDLWETVEEGKKVGLAGVLAWELAYRNDESFGSLTPEERFEKFLAWIDEQLLLPPVLPRPRKPRPVSRIKQKLAAWQQLSTGA